VSNERVSILVPMYNEEKIVEQTALQVWQALRGLHIEFELILMDDNSQDDTFAIASRLAKQHKEIKVIRFSKGPSRRENLGVAMTKASGSIVGFVDADLATDLAHLRELIDAIKIEGYDVAIGSRYKGITAERSRYRLLISKLYNRAIRWYFGSIVLDHQCDFKCFKKKVVLELVDEMGYDKEFKRGWFWDAELLIRAQRKGLKIKEFPVRWQASKQSSFHPGREARMLPYWRELKKRLKYQHGVHNTLQNG